MRPDEFIEKNLIRELEKLGFDDSACHMAAREGMAHFHRASRVSMKGKLFDECLSVAKSLAKKQISKRK